MFNFCGLFLKFNKKILNKTKIHFSLTAHWIDMSTYEQKKCVLAVRPLTAPHTGDFLAGEIRQMLQQWNIPDEQVHVYIKSFPIIYINKLLP